MLKVSDLQNVMENGHLLLNIQWILTKNVKEKITMKAVALLAKLCEQVPRSRAFLRDNLALTGTLTSILTSVGSEAAGKVLELLRFIAHGISINRPESYLEKLIFHLLR